MTLPFRRLLVFQDDSRHCKVWTRQAVELAERWDSQLVGFHVEPSVANTNYTDASIGTGLGQTQKDLERTRNRELREAFVDTTQQAGVTAEWVARVGDPVVETRRFARYVDLAIIGSRTNRSDDMNDLSRVAEHVAVGSGCPTLVLPEAHSGPVTGKSIAVCWDGSREASRVLRDALPLLREASQVHVLNADEDDTSRPGMMQDQVVAHLIAHGIDAKVHSALSKRNGTGRVLLDKAGDLQADMIVLGAYGHARLRELVLGGVTQHMLRYAEIPVFMAH